MIKWWKGYLREAQRGGITDPGCLIYIADIINQYGSAPGLVNSGINNLDELYAYSLSNGYGKYASRRKRVYDAIKSLQSQGKLNTSMSIYRSYIILWMVNHYIMSIPTCIIPWISNNSICNSMGTYSSGLGCSFNPEPYLRR